MMPRVERALKALAASMALLLPPAGAASAAECREITEEGRSYSLCQVDAAEDLRLFLTDPEGSLYGTFERLRRALAGGGERLVFAVNAGMYHPDRRPVGLYIENRRQLAPIVTGAGPGNFGMLPNGVFCIGPGRFAVIESRAFRQAPPDCLHATQSGPMLVIDGALHPRFLEDSSSRHVRNGVGVSADGRTAYFVISNGLVTFHEFGRLFRDRLGLGNALYLDGSVSKLYAPALGRADLGRQMGPILGLVVPGG